MTLKSITSLNTSAVAALTILAILISISASVKADPCGMVPPIYNGQGPPITRIGLQKTFVFHKDGVETFVIRPGFSGKVDQFGMLIPFPSVPSIRKVPDNIFGQIVNAIDPPEVVINLNIRNWRKGGGKNADRLFSRAREEKSLEVLKRDEVVVLKQEAVGMYEVAVLGAGSSEALKKWMTAHGYRFPDGMEEVANEYIDDKWCFVAVKTKVGQKDGVNPKPAQREVDPKLDAGASFDGFVQAMGFRFESEKLVVPMRLSTFNEGDLRNVVYIMTDGPRKIRNIPEEYVVRQISGKDLLGNLTNPLPLRVIGGTVADLQLYHRTNLTTQRDPTPKNGLAKQLLASDLLAVETSQLSLAHEEIEKQLLQIGEHFGLRGSQIDAENAIVLKKQADKTTAAAIGELAKMTLTVIDGDFPREVLSGQNLSFVEYKMPSRRNNPLKYDAKAFGPTQPKAGILIQNASLNFNSDTQLALTETRDFSWSQIFSLLACSLLTLGALIFTKGRKMMQWFTALFFGVGLTFAASQLVAVESPAKEDAVEKKVDLDAASNATLMKHLGDGKTAQAAIGELTKRAKADEKKRDEIIEILVESSTKSEDMVERGWAIATLAKIGGLDIDEKLTGIHSDSAQPKLVRTWAAAARVSMVKTPAALVEKASLISAFPSLGRPIGMRLLEEMNKEGSDVTVGQMISLSNKTPQLQQALITPILAAGADKLTETMVKDTDMNVRRQAAAFLGTLAQQNAEGVAKAVIAIYEPNTMANKVPWDGGPLYVPGIQWEKELAKQLVGNLVAWNTWCEENGKSQEQQQIYNNLRSVSLSRVVGYSTPGGTSSVEWLKSWSAVVGKKGISEIVESMGLSDKDKYKKLLDSL